MDAPASLSVRERIYLARQCANPNVVSHAAINASRNLSRSHTDCWRAERDCRDEAAVFFAVRRRLINAYN